MPTPARLSPAQAAARLAEYVVVDVRSPGEHASGHLPGAHNVPLERLDEALPALRAAAARRNLLVVCASGARANRACGTLAAADIASATLTGGTSAWSGEGHELHRPAGDGARAVWPMERQVRLAAGSLVLTGLAAGVRIPAARWLSAGIGAGLVFSAATDTCGMAALLSRLPHNRAAHDADTFESTLDALRR